MGSSSKKVKTAKQPDFTKAYNTDLAANKASWEAGLNASRPNQNGLFGSMNWAKDANGNWTQTESLNDQTQGIFDSQQQNQQTIADKAGQAIGGLDTSQINFDSARAAPEVGGYNQQVIDTLRQIQQPAEQRARASKEAQLAAMGLGTGSGSAYNTQQNLIGQNENDAELKRIMAGFEQGNTEYDQALRGRQQDISDILGQREANLTQAGALDNMSNYVTSSGVSNVGQVGGYDTPSMLDAMQAQYKAAQDAANAKNAGKSNGKGGLLGAAKIGTDIYGKSQGWG